MNQHAKYPDRRSFTSNVIVQTHWTDCSKRTNSVVGNKNSSCSIGIMKVISLLLQQNNNSDNKIKPKPMRVSHACLSCASGCQPN